MKTFVRLSLLHFPVVLTMCAFFLASSCQPTSDYTTQKQVPSLRASIGNPIMSPKPKFNFDAETSAIIHKGLDWLVDAQFENGAWGAGSHSQQNIFDPHAVQADPATTAFAAMALLRSGNTLQSGAYKSHLKKALEFLLQTVESSDNNSPNITSITGTQPQVKLGQNIDVSMASRFFTRILPLTEDEKLATRIQNAQTKCIRKIEKSQGADGSIQGGTWAGVLQSAVATMALEEAVEAGQEVDTVAYERIKEFQKSNVDISTGAVSTGSAAGIQLYSLSSTNRATAKDYKKAQKVIEDARNEGKFDDHYERDEAIPVTEETLKEAGVNDEEAKVLVQGYTANKIARTQVQTDAVMRGFGNNGGEEFLSHMMTSESLIVTGGEEWNSWNDRMKKMMGGIQNQNGSWSGHHCITSPVFCTAAVILTLTVENDDMLTRE